MLTAFDPDAAKWNLLTQLTKKIGRIQLIYSKPGTNISMITLLYQIGKIPRTSATIFC